MLKQIIKIIRAEFKKSNVKSFLFFLGFSSVIWLLVQFSRTYNEVLTVPVSFENYPKDKLIEKEGDNLDIRVEQNGFQIAWFKLFRPQVSIDIEDLPQDSTYFVYKIKDHQAELNRKFPMDINKVDFLNTEIRIPFQFKKEKKLPIVSNVKIQYAPGYSSEETLEFDPDSVMVSGKEKVIDTLTKVYTKKLTLKNVKKTLEGEVELDDFDTAITLYEEKVAYNLPVEKFTERQLTIPLTVINVPPGEVVNLYPPSVDVRFKVSLERFKQIQSIDFQLVVDYNDISEDNSFVIPKITKSPRIIKGIDISPRKVQYVIRK